MEPPEFPKAVGVIFCAPAPSYEESVHGQIAEIAKKSPPTDMNALLRRGHTWTVN
jgi:2-oxoglutarate ferredoxin oxidoreductase subunit beta